MDYFSIVQYYVNKFNNISQRQKFFHIILLTKRVKRDINIGKIKCNELLKKELIVCVDL